MKTKKRQPTAQMRPNLRPEVLGEIWSSVRNAMRASLKYFGPTLCAKSVNFALRLNEVQPAFHRGILIHLGFCFERLCKGTRHLGDRMRLRGEPA